MASFHVSVTHALAQETARVRVEQFLAGVEREYAAHISDVRGQWSDNTLHFGFVASGVRISGTLAVEPRAVDVSGPLPLMAALFRGRIEQTIREQLEKLLA
jgi:hypothetical protein